MKIPLLVVLLGLVPVSSCWSAAAQEGAGEQPTHQEVAPLKIPLGKNGKITTMAMASDGTLLLGTAWSPEADAQVPPERLDEDGHVNAVQVVDPKGGVLATWPMLDGLAAKMIHCTDEGQVYIGGRGQLALYDLKGKRVKQIDTDLVVGAKALTSGLHVSQNHVFVAFGYGNSLRATEDIFRLNRDLTGGKKIIERQFGCCAHLDLQVVGEQLLVAENSRHRVNVFDFEGNLQSRWGKRDRVSLEGFAACCNPVNVDLGQDGFLYTAESGIGRVKKYSPDGKYLGLVGYVDTTQFDRGSRLAAQSCYIPVEVNRDASRVYIMDVRAHIIRVLERLDKAGAK